LVRDEIVLEAGDYRAVLRRTGACLRGLRHRGRDLLMPGEGEETPDYAGVVLAPWPNRVIDGRYTFEGQEHVLEVDEPDRGHALHGLVASVPAEVSEVGAAHVAFAHRLRNRPGYPFEIDVTTRYSLGAFGLTCEIEARTVGGRRAPYGCGAHPYLRAAGGRTDDCVLEVPGAEVLEVEGERLLPGGVVPVAGTPYDFRRPRRLGEQQVDNAFTGLDRGADGRVRARLTDPEGHGVELWADEAFGWLHVYTCDRADTSWDRRGVALEPTTCPPGAFGSDRDLVVLAPGERHRATWGLAAAGGAG
jgi:aldose 1-epimerase